MSLADIRAEHTRGALLGLLVDDIWWNDAILHDAVNAVKHMDGSREDVRDAMRWLANQRLVEIEEIPVAAGQRSILRVRIAERGRDFEAGKTFVEGIKRRSGS